MIRAFWQFDYGPQAGIKHAVKNLGWLIRHAPEVTNIQINRSINGAADFIAILKGGRRYVTRFESYSVACRWVQRPSLRNAHKFFN